MAALRQHDPIEVLGASLRRAGTLTEARDQELRRRVDAQIAEAFEFARNSAYPPADDAFRHVFS